MRINDRLRKEHKNIRLCSDVILSYRQNFCKGYANISHFLFRADAQSTAYASARENSQNCILHCAQDVDIIALTDAFEGPKIY